jgi:hypothetical protein
MAERSFEQVVGLDLRLLDPRTRATLEEVDRLRYEDWSARLAVPGAGVHDPLGCE